MGQAELENDKGLSLEELLPSTNCLMPQFYLCLYPGRWEVGRQAPQAGGSVEVPQQLGHTRAILSCVPWREGGSKRN